MSEPAALQPLPDSGDGPAESRAKAGFLIVGVGASAGGLAAFEAFFSAMPTAPAPDMAFILVQHLAPDHKSILGDLVQRYTSMQVYDVEDGVIVQPNCAYIIPPNCDMALMDGALHLFAPAAPRGMRLPIDFFFRSLAQDLRERAIAIVLSGTGSDGTLGVRAIKGEGGMVMAQDPTSAPYDGMPRSAIATGLVDYVLEPAAMPQQLVAYAARISGPRPPASAAPTLRADEMLKNICILLRDQTGHDFSQYKESTLLRRIERRMALHQIDRAEDYLSYARQQPSEVDALFHDLLIGVTRFFRDPEAFAWLESQVIPQLFATGVAGGALRVWVCGCSTGEEAYSLAILIQEQIERIRQRVKVQIFATDIDTRAIDQARSGIFPASIAADIAPERLARFFVPAADGQSFRVHKTIRDLLIFSVQDVVKDPPFSKLALISCRNLLIYLNADLQRKLIPLFHYALSRNGVLFLGTSETVGELSTLFSALDRKWKIYQRRDDAVGAMHPLIGSLVPRSPAGASAAPQRGARAGANKIDLRRLAEQALLSHYDPVGILVSARGEILHIIGRTGNYLEPAQGDVDLSILTMAREGLRRELTTALHRAVAEHQPVSYSGLRVRTNGSFASVNLSVRPVPTGAEDPAIPDLFLVVLEAIVPDLTAQPHIAEDAAPEEEQTGRVAVLERELRAKEEYVQTTLEEMETANEELMSANEELQSLNEELQSTNEELETSKEELQSVNEELATVNAELQNKVFDLSRINNDMNNLLAGTGVGTLFVDMQLRIARFTPAITQVINLISPDIGRPVGDIVSNLINYRRLVEDVQEVLDTLVPREAEVQTRAGAWYLMRIRPYRTLEQVIEGAVLTFVDITQRKQIEAALRSSEMKFAKAFRAIPDGLAVCRREDGRILDLNESGEALWGLARPLAIGRNLPDLGLLADPTAWAQVIDHLQQQGAVRSMELELCPIAKERRRVLLSVEQFEVEVEPCLLLIFHDSAERRRAEEAPPV